jgi:integrase
MGGGSSVGRVLPPKDRSIAAAQHSGKGPEVEYRIEGNPGLILAVIRPSRKGLSTRTWRVHYSVTRSGQRIKRKVKLGHYPVVSLAEARRRAAEIAEAVDQGRDPVAEEKAVEAGVAQATMTFRDLVAEYLADQRAVGVRSVPEIERALRHNALPALGHRNPASITDVEIEQVVDAVAARGSKAMARHLLVYLRGVFNHALLDSPRLREKYRLQSNPASFVGRTRRGKTSKYGKPARRERTLADSEISTFWSCLDDASHVPLGTRIALKLLVVTGQRRGEICGARVDELNLDGVSPTWDLPATRTKNGEPHSIPLSRVAVQLFRRALSLRRKSCDLVFLSFKSPSEPLKGNHITGALERLFEKGHLRCPRFSPHDLPTHSRDWTCWPRNSTRGS